LLKVFLLKYKNNYNQYQYHNNKGTYMYVGMKQSFRFLMLSFSLLYNNLYQNLFFQVLNIDEIKYLTSYMLKFSFLKFELLSKF